MENQQIKESIDKILKEQFGVNTEIYDSAMKVYDIICDFVNFLKDKYPGTTSGEVATIGMQLFLDSCKYNKMSKSDIMALVINILSEM